MTARAPANATNIEPGDVINERDLPPHILRDDADDDANNDDSASLLLFESWLDSIDVVLLLGGGVPHSPNEPPAYVQRRCDAVASIMRARTGRGEEGGEEVGGGRGREMSVICLSAGTAHLPQYVLHNDGLPLWESTASASYLMSHPIHPVPVDRIYVETSSYDTISNAYFARTVFTDVVNNAVDHYVDDDARVGGGDGGGVGGVGKRRWDGRSWRRILVVTNEFHVRRTKAIFDWVFGAPISSSTSKSTSPPRNDGYEMYYLSCDNVGLDENAIDARASHEARGERNVREYLSRTYVTLRDIWEFLVKEHDFYSASGLVRRANATISGNDVAGGSSDVLKLSYGKSSGRNGGGSDTDDDGMGGEERKGKTLEYVNGRISLRIDASPLSVAAAMTTLLTALTVVVFVVGAGKTRGR